MIEICECPRDAMQGVTDFIPTSDKIQYINALMKVGFDTLDFGSFVSPKAIPQMRDTAEILKNIDTNGSKTRLLAIVPNVKGAIEAVKYDQIHFLGYPFSISKTFLQRNLNASIEDAFQRLQNIQYLCQENQKQLVVYVSMAFGNPYDEHWDIELLKIWVKKLDKVGVCSIALSDTTGNGTHKEYKQVFETLVPLFPHIEFGLHMHTTQDNWQEKLQTAYDAGCRHFDTVVNDKGGCPMSGKALAANLNTYNLLAFMEQNGEDHKLDLAALKVAAEIADQIFPEE